MHPARFQLHCGPGLPGALFWHRKYRAGMNSSPDAVRTWYLRGVSGRAVRLGPGINQVKFMPGQRAQPFPPAFTVRALTFYASFLAL